MTYIFTKYKNSIRWNNNQKTNSCNIKVQNEKPTISQQNIKREIIISIIYQQNIDTKSIFPKQPKIYKLK